MPVVRRGDEDRVDILVIQNFAVIQMSALQVGVALMHGVAARLVHVAGRDNVKAANAVGAIDQCAQATAAADQADANEVVGASDS